MPLIKPRILQKHLSGIVGVELVRLIEWSIAVILAMLAVCEHPGVSWVILADMATSQAQM